MGHEPRKDTVNRLCSGDTFWLAQKRGSLPTSKEAGPSGMPQLWLWEEQEYRVGCMGCPYTPCRQDHSMTGWKCWTFI